MALQNIVAFVAALCACAVTAIRADVGEPSKVGIRLRIDRSITAIYITERLKDETEAIWRAYGIQLDWTDARASALAAHGVALDAIVERGGEEPQRKNWARVLGRAVVGPEALNWQPIRVSFDATERVLALRARGWASMPRIVRDGELARALGRVLAHEIGHVLLGTTHHDEAGLMRAVFRADELAEPARAPFRLTRSGVGRLRRRLGVLKEIGRSRPIQVEALRWSQRGSPSSCEEGDE